MTDPAKFRREHIRWIVLLALNNARPVGASDRLLLSVARAEYPDITLIELRRELDYLADRKLVELRLPHDGGEWRAGLTRYGVDVVEYTVNCEPGIARPEKYY